MWLGAFVERETGLRETPTRSAFTSGPGSATCTPGSGPTTSRRSAPTTPTPSSWSTPSAAASTQAMEFVAAGDVEAEGVHMLSTSADAQHVESNPEAQFIVATENGMLLPAPAGGAAAST